MAVDVGAHIAGLLYDHTTVTIPGLGGFVGAYQPANLDQVQGKLHAPAKNIRFDANLAVDDGLLIARIQQEDLLPYEEAKKLVRDYVDQIQEALTRREMVVFPAIGRLYRDYEGVLQFLPEDTNFNTQAYGLPTIHFFPITRQASDIPANLLGGTKPQPKSVPLATTIGKWIRQYQTILIIAGALVLATSIFVIFRDQISGLFTGKPTSEVPSSRVNVPPVANEDSPGEDEDAVPAAPEQEPAADAEAPTPAPDQRVCIIAIGLFREKSNVDRLVQQLIEEGYEPYTEKQGDLTRVGIQFLYTSQSEIEERLRVAKKQFDQRAVVWKQ